MTILVTGGFGFIGSNFVLGHLNEFPLETVVILDKMTYAANPAHLADADKKRLVVYRGDIGNEELVANILSTHSPRAIINFAAESHVDRSIAGPASFIETNINGLATLLELARQYAAYKATLKESFRFIQVSTDEVYGSLQIGAACENWTPYAPRSPYAASKAAGDHLCKSYFITYGLPVILTNAGNNYGPRQHMEKFIPTAIDALVHGGNIPVYGKGVNVREWIYVDDHCKALELILEKGKIGEQYHIGSDYSMTNLALTTLIGDTMRKAGIQRDWSLPFISFVPDRPGHDLRYALDCSKMKALGWDIEITMEMGMEMTVDWYLKN